MTSRPSRFPAAAKRRQPAQLGSGLVAMIVASLLCSRRFLPAACSFDAARCRHRPKPQQPGSVQRADGANKIAELEEQFWVCDYLGTTRGIEGPLRRYVRRELRGTETDEIWWRF